MNVSIFRFQVRKSFTRRAGRADQREGLRRRRISRIGSTVGHRRAVRIPRQKSKRYFEKTQRRRYPHAHVLGARFQGDAG